MSVSEFYMVSGMFLVTFTIRYIMCPLSGKFEFPELVERALTYVPPAILSAIIIPSVFMPADDTLWINFDNPYLVGAVCAGLAGWFSKNLLLTILSGMVVFLTWQWVIT